MQRFVSFDTFEGRICQNDDKSCDFLNDLLPKLEVTTKILKDGRWPIICLFWILKRSCMKLERILNDFLTKPKVRTCILKVQTIACSDSFEGFICKFCENLFISLTESILKKTWSERTSKKINAKTKQIFCTLS